MRSRRRILAAATTLTIGAAVVAGAIAATSGRNLSGGLAGSQEVPAVSTGASATFRASIARDGESIDWTLSYAGLEADATQAHIHFGQRSVNGGISVWLCSRLASPPTPPGVEQCPLREGTVSGTADADDVVGPAAQGIEPRQLAELVAAIRSGLAYANVHSGKFPGGEIRAQLEPGSGS